MSMSGGASASMRYSSFGSVQPATRCLAVRGLNSPGFGIPPGTRCATPWRRSQWRVHPRKCMVMAISDVGSRPGLLSSRSIRDWENRVQRVISAPGYFGEYRLKHEELEVFREFAKSMRECGTAFAAVAVSNILLTLLKSGQAAIHAPMSVILGVTVGNFALWSDSLVVAILLHYGANVFQRISEDEHRDKLPFVFQGIGRLSLIFQQFAVAAAALAIVHTLEASATYPRITSAASILFISVAAIRTAALAWLMRKHGKESPDGEQGDAMQQMLTAAREDRPVTRLERAASRLVMGHLLVYHPPQAAAADDASQNGHDSDLKGSRREHEFTAAEEQTLRICVDAMHTAGLALGVQGLATWLYAAAMALTGNLESAAPMAYNGFSKTLSAVLLFKSSSTFDTILVSQGQDVTNLLRGLGSEGLSKLFHNLNGLAWGVVASQLLQAALPIVKQSAVTQLGAAIIITPQIIRLITVIQDGLLGF